MKKVLPISMCFALTTSMLTACGASASNINNYIENFDFENAYEYYVDNIEESKKKDEIDTEIKSAMDDIYETLLEKYSAEELDADNITYLEKLASEASFYESDEYITFINNINLIDFSSNAYEEGMTMYDKKDYSSAIHYFEMVLEIDLAHYSDAQDKNSECEKLLSDQKTESIRNLISSGEYQEAIQEINFLTDSNLAKTLTAEIETAVTSEVDSKINSYFSDFDYNGAYDYLYDLNGQYGFESLKTRLNGLEDEFVQYSLSKAEENAADNNYEAASAVIQQAIDMIGEENENLNSAYNEYRSHLPIYITDMEYMSCVNRIETQEKLKDNIGNTYHNGLFMARDISFLGDKGWYGEGSADYYLNGKYAIFSGTVAVPTKNENNTRSSYFEVYGDGKLLYTSPVMEKNSFPENFSINITGVQVLKISYPESNENSELATIYDGLLTPQGNTESTKSKGNLETTSNSENLCADSSNWNSFVYKEKGVAATLSNTRDGVKMEVTKAAGNWLYYTQIKYDNIILEKNATYSVEFDYNTSDNVDFEYVIQHNDEPYNYYMGEVFKSYGDGHYSAEFTMEETDDNVTIAFNCNNPDVATPYSLTIENLSLVRIS